MTRPLTWLFAALALTLIPASLHAQDPSPGTDTAGEPLRMYLDCSGFFCESDFFRTEIDFVSHMRDRQDADVYILATRQQTGAGGARYTLTFTGQRAQQAQPNATLFYVSPPASSEDDVRQGLARIIKLGLIPFLAGSPVAEFLDVTYSPPAGATVGQAAAVSDPWNRWTFRAGVSGSLNGQSRSNSWDGAGSFSANRITEDWKIQLRAQGQREQNRFEVSDTNTVTSEQHGYGASARIVRSLGPRLSAGAVASGESSTFLNQDLHLRLASAVEYNVFPYAESTRRQFTFQYSLGANSYRYREETIFEKTSDFLPDQRLVASLDLRQPWGSVSVSAEGRQYLNDLERYSGQLFSNLDIQIVRGLSLNLFGRVSYVRDQLYLPAGDASEEEVLLRLRQLETSYFYFLNVGFSYTFGSIYNSVVNPRLGGGGGGGF